MVAVEKIISLNKYKHGTSRLADLDLENRPTFGFGNSSKNQCVSTASLEVHADGKPGQVEVHALDAGAGPVLFSIESLRALGAIIDFSEEKLSQGFHGHVGKLSDSSHCTEPEPPLPAALQHKLDEIPNKFVIHSHASCHQKGIGGRAPDDLWRDRSKTVEHHGDRESPLGTQGSQWNGHAEREGTATYAPCHDRAEQGQQEEVRPPGLREQQAHGEDSRHRDHPGAAAPGHQEDLPDHSRLSGGSCGVRGALQSAVPRAPSPAPTVCQLGREDRHRGGMRLPPGSSANWLQSPEAQHPMPTYKQTSSGYKNTSTPATGSNGKTENMMQMMQMMHALKEDVDNLKAERPHKKVEASSGSFVPIPQ